VQLSHLLVSVKYQEISPLLTQAVDRVEVFLELKSASTPKHTTDKKATVKCGFFYETTKVIA
jgi:hypothetical protein